MTEELAIAKLTVYEEVQALKRVLEELDWERFGLWVCRIADEDVKVVVTGVGKSAIAARKIAATLATSGVQALFVDPVGMFHGELGLMRSGDAVIMVSRSGETEELVRLLGPLRSKVCAVLPLVGVIDSPLGKWPAALCTGVAVDPGCGVPTVTSAAAVAVGDALAAAVGKRLKTDLAENHPGGALGLQLRAGCVK